MQVEIVVNENWVLTDIREGDGPLFISYLTDPAVTATLSAVPDPYTEESADYWIRLNREDLLNGRPRHFAIRDKEGLLLGCAGFHDWDGITRTHKSALGYWVGKPHWGKGIATAATKTLVRFGFETLKLERVSAFVFEGNLASERVLVKAGFKKEGVAKKEFIKNGRFLDGILYGITK